MGVGGGSQKQSSQQQSSGGSQSYGSAMNLAQERQFQNLWGAAGNLYSQNAGAGYGQDAYSAALGGNQQGMGYLNQGAGQVANALGQLGGANQAMNTLGALQNPTVDPMLGVYAQEIGQQFNRNVLPGIQGNAAMAGALGGSRAGIAQGLAAADAQRNIQNFGAQLYGQGQDRALSAAGAQGQLAQALAQTGLQGAGMYGQLGQQAMQGGLNNLAIGQFGMGVPWYAAQQFAGLLGNPLLEDLGGTSSTTSSGASEGKGNNFKAYIW